MYIVLMIGPCGDHTFYSCSPDICKRYAIYRVDSGGRIMSAADAQKPYILVMW